MLSKEELAWAVGHWTLANYIAAASIYLQDNFLLERKLEKGDIKDKLVGHWGTCPGINFIYTHLNLLASKTKQSILPVVGPGHGFASLLANSFIDGTLERYYSAYSNDKAGLGKLIKSFCWPGKFPSHANPGFPGILLEGGELGYALSTSFGAVLDNPDLLAVAVIGDGEAETGPTAAAWHSNKFLSKKDGAVLPILHLNGYKIANPTIFGTMTSSELRDLFSGYGYEVKFVGENHREMHDALLWAYHRIKNRGEKWPMIILRTRKGWTCPAKDSYGNKLEGSWRSHQVPIRPEDEKSLKLVESWLASYKPSKLFEQGCIPRRIMKFIPKKRISDNFHVLTRKNLKLPDSKESSIKISRGQLTRNAEVLAGYLSKVIDKNDDFRIFSPDELESNKLGAVLKKTKKVYSRDVKDVSTAREGKVMEILSEHTLQGWYQGYLLTGRHGIYPCYESFMPIIDSMVSQHLKFIKQSKNYSWRKPIGSANYLLSSTCWRQDHNGFSHQNPGFINMALSKATEEQLVRVYFPADANSLLVAAEKSLASRDRVNLIISDKQIMRQWLSYNEAYEQAKKGAAIWKFASDDRPEVVVAAAGDYQTAESLAAIKLVKSLANIKIRMVNVSEINVLGGKLYPNSLEENEFNSIFTKDKQVIFSFHGYPETIKQLLFDRPDNSRFHIYGYIEKGTTTTAFDMLVQNKVSRYDIARRIIKNSTLTTSKKNYLLDCLKGKIGEHQNYIHKHGKDPEEVTEWQW